MNVLGIVYCTVLYSEKVYGSHVSDLASGHTNIHWVRVNKTKDKCAIVKIKWGRIYWIWAAAQI